VPLARGISEVSWPPPSQLRDAWDYMAAIGKEREARSHWQKVRKLILEEADLKPLAGTFG